MVLLATYSHRQDYCKRSDDMYNHKQYLACHIKKGGNLSMRATKEKTQGFTIIEVVLVLAIAGLIFLVVFLALPALQRGQRDTQRKQDLGRFMSQLVAYQGNNQNALPSSYTANSAFVKNYLTNNQTFNDPSTGSTYSISTPTASPSAPAPSIGELFVYISARCQSANDSGVEGISPANNRVVAVVIHQEQGGLSCQTNQ
jgi:prepilin-type N-terminal cleavage/methylation domain-containing protein